MFQLPDHPDIADCMRTGYPRGYGWPYNEPTYDEDEEDCEDAEEE